MMDFDADSAIDCIERAAREEIMAALLNSGTREECAAYELIEELEVENKRLQKIVDTLRQSIHYDSEYRMAIHAGASRDEAKRRAEAAANAVTDRRREG